MKKPRTPEVNQELLKKSTGSLYLITDPKADIFLKKHEQLRDTRRMV
jgi:hypothetical protein